MDTYKCPACGGTVAREGCQRCGQPYDADVAALAMFKRTVAALEAKKRQYEKDQVQLRTQIAHASAQRDSLARLVREKAEREAKGGRSIRSRIVRRGGTPAGAPSGPASTPPGAAPAAAPGTAPSGPAGPPGTASPGPARPAHPAPSPPGAPGAGVGTADSGPAAAAAGASAASPSDTGAGPSATGAGPGRGASGPGASAAAPAGRTAPPRKAPPRTPTGTPTPRPGEPAPPPAGPGRRVGGLPPAIAARLPGYTSQVPRQGQTRFPRRSRPLGAGAGQGPPGAAGRGRPGGSGTPVYRIGDGPAGTVHLPEAPAAETTTAASQSVLLAVGGLLLAGAAVVLAVFGFGSLGALGRVGMLALATVILLTLPMMLIRRRLTATAETVASVGLLMVLLDGYVIWSLRLLGAARISTTVYFGLVCLATALIANAYRGASHLVAPRYATVLVLQPVIPLLGYDLIKGPAGWALVLTGVAALDLAFGISLTRPGRFATLAGFVRPVHLHLGHLPGQQPAPPPPEEPPAEPEGPPMRPETAPEEPDDVKMATDVPVTAAPVLVEAAPPAPRPPAILRDLTWVLFTLAFGAALSYATVALVTTTSLPPTVRAAVVLLLAASLGVGGALTWRRYPLPDVAAGLATLAVVISVVRVGATALPGHTLLFAALAVAIAAVIVPMLPDQARQGPRLASSAAAAGTAAYLLWQAVPAIGGPVAAARPWWHADLPGYSARIGAAAGPAGWQLVVAGALLTLAVALALPGWIRVYAVLGGGVLTMLTVPAALHLNWMVTPALLALVAIGVGAFGLTAQDKRSASGFVAAAGVLGTYATLTSLTHPAVTSLTLAAITIGGYMIAMLRPLRTDPMAELVGQLVGGWAGGGAAFALPGAVCAGLAALIREDVFPGADAAFVLAGGFVAVSGTLGYAAVRLLAGRRQSRPLLLGTSLGAFVVAIAALVTHSHGATIIDMAVGLLLLASSIVLWLAPSMSSRVILGQELTGNDIAAGAVAASATAALSRVLALLVPGIGLVTTAILVLIVAVATRSLPAEQRRGPIAGEMLIGIVIAGASGAAAIGDAVGVVHAANPLWHADLGATWIQHAAQYSLYGWQAPMTLLLVAAAAVTVVPRPLGDDIAAVAVGLAALGAPVGFRLPWWSPMVIGILAIIALGVSAAATDVARTGYTRIGVAGVVAFFTAAASLVRPSVTSATLESLAITSTLVAVLAGIRLAGARTPETRVARAHLTPIGGGASATAVLAIAGAAGALAAGEHHPVPVILAGALAATCLALPLAGLLCWRMPSFLPYVTAAVAIAGSAIALAAIPYGLPVGLYAATATLLGVLAELLRVNAIRRIGWHPEDGWQPVGDWSATRDPQPSNRWLPGRAWLAAGRWRPADPTSFGGGAAAASAIPAAIAVAAVSLPLVAALFGPYHFGRHPWTATPATASDLYPFNGWIAHPTDVITAAALTFAGALAAVGLGGPRQLVANRVVAVAVPGAGLTMLLVPGALHAGQVQATFALLVSTLCGLSLALTTPPSPESVESNALRIARRLVFGLAVLAALAGQLGSLATRSMTMEALAGSIVVGAIGAIWGRYPLARMIGWNVAVGAAALLAVEAPLAAGFPARMAAFPLLAVTALAVALAAMLPRFRTTASIGQEIMVIEGTAFLGMIGALALTIGSPRYTALACTALGAVLGLAASRPGRAERHLQTLIFAAAAAEVLGVWLLMRTGNVSVPEAYSLPFALFALLVGILELHRRPDLGSWLAYGPALVAGFLPSVVLVLMTDTAPARRVLVIVAGVLTVALGSVRRQKAPVVVGSVVTAVATLHELLLLGRMLPWWVLLIVFGLAGALLVGLGATYEKRRQSVTALRSALNRLR